MAVIYSVVQLERNASNDGVVVCHWRASDSETDSDNVLHAGANYGTCSFSPNPDSESWVEFVDITEELAIQWCKDSMGEEAVTSIESSIASQIAESKSPSVIAELPW